MRGFGALHARRLFEHPLRAGLTLVGIVSATALLVAVPALSESLTGSIARSAALAGRAEVQVSGVSDTGFDERLFFDVERTAGVRAAVPYVQTPVEIGGVRALLVGFDGRARALGGTGDQGLAQRLQPPDVNLNGVFLGPRLARLAHLGQRRHVGVGSGTAVQDASMLGLLPEGALTRLNGGVVALAALPVAQRLAHMPQRLDGIYVVARPGIGPAVLERRLSAVLGGRAVVSSPRLLADQAAAAAAALRTGLFAVSFLALYVAGFVVFNTMSMAALERRRELATLRALGGRRRALLVGFLGEAALLGLLGAAAGAGIGVVVAQRLVSHIPTELVAAFDLRVSFLLPRSAVPLALLYGTGLAVVAAAFPARRAVSVAPVEAMRPEGVLETRGEGERVRWWPAVGGLAAVAAGSALGLTAGRRAALGATALLWSGALVSSFGFAASLAAGAAWIAARFRTAGRLAATSVSRAPRRVFATVTAVSAGVALIVAQTGTEHNVNASLWASYSALAHTDLVVTTVAPENRATDLLLPDRLGPQVAQLPGVARLSTEQESYATLGADRVMLRGVGTDSVYPDFRLAPPAARRAVLAGTAVVVTGQLARYQHLRRGDTLALPTPMGVKAMTVAAVVDTFASERGNLVLSLRQLQAWYGRPGLTTIEVTAAPGVDRGALRRAVGASVAAAGVRATVETGREAARHIVGIGRQVAGAFNAIQLVIVIGAGLAIFNTLAISVVERRRELGILRAVGTNRRQLRRSVLAESVGIGTLGAGIGLALGLIAHYLVVLDTRSVGGVPVRYHFDPTPLALAAGAAVVLTTAGALAPAWRAARLNVIEAIGYE